jgi:hypothetical protein
MNSMIAKALTTLTVIAAGSAAAACEPGASLAAKGGFAPSFASAPAGFGAYGAFQEQKQLLAQQAAAYQAQRQQLRLAKAMQAREKTLADRAQRRALAVQKLQDYRRRKGLDDPTSPDSPLLASGRATLNR